MENIMSVRRTVFTMDNFWFFLACGLFIVQYGRLYPPQLEAIRPFALMAFSLAGLLFLSGKNIFQAQYAPIQAVWAIIIWMTLGIPFAMNYGNAFLTTRSVMMFLPFMLSIILLINDVRRLKILVNVVLFVAALNTFRGYINFDGAGRNTMFHLGAFLGDPNDYSLYMNMMIPFAYFGFLQELRWNWKKIACGLLAVAMVAMVVMSFSRGGMVGLACAGIVMWYYSPNRAVTFTLGMVGLVCVLIFSSDQWINIMSSATNLEASTTSQRLTLWIASIDIFVDHPVMGVGASNIPFHLSNYVYDGFVHQFIVAHSIWFTALAEWGLVGFGLFIWLFAANFSSAARLTRVNQVNLDARYLKYFGAATMSSLVAFMASGSFLTVNYYPHLWYLTAMIVVGIKVLNNLYVRDYYPNERF